MRSELTPAWEVRPDLQTTADVEGKSLLHEKRAGTKAQDHGT